MSKVNDVLDDAAVLDLLEVGITQLAFGAELLPLQRQSLLGLAVECWILNQAIDEHK